MPPTPLRSGGGLIAFDMALSSLRSKPAFAPRHGQTRQVVEAGSARSGTGKIRLAARTRKNLGDLLANSGWILGNRSGQGCPSRVPLEHVAAAGLVRENRRSAAPAVPVPASGDRARCCSSPGSGACSGLRIARRSRPWSRASRAPEVQPAALVFGKEVLGTDLVGVFGDQPAFAFDARRPDRLDQNVSIGDADKGGGRVVDDDQGLKRDQRR